MKKRQLFHVKNVFKNIKNQLNYRVAALSTLYLTVLGINIPILKSIGQF